jgi:exodeoxyribonuclease V beta subunit
MSASDNTAGTLLQPLTFPLSGSRLIEASAGTGKTYTIAALYVRLVLGHGEEAAYARALVPPEILVVTFTDAATKELRERIRARLAQAAAYFLADPSVPAEGDELLRQLRDDYPPAQWPGCARRLQLAAEWMDEAAVSTIHGWCNRMLREHAFDSGSLFTQALETDQSELLAESARDYWRSFIAPLDAAAAAEVLGWWPGPEELQSAVRPLLPHVDLLTDAPAPGETLGRARAEREEELARLKAPWGAWVDEIDTLLDQAVAGKCVDGRKLQPRYYRQWLQALRDWAEDLAMISPDLKTGWERLTPQGLAEITKEGKQTPEHSGFVAIAGLGAALKALPDGRDAILRHAARWIAARFAAEQHGRAQMGFDDLLTRLAAALTGPNGERLAARIRASFPVALIDEFQDTDPVQYRIFDAVYRVAVNDPATALILIGDPKQAIYSFRGADIHTYLVARRACAGRWYTLGRNYRATAAMVAATNACFARAERRADGAGAFLFRTADGNEVPFVAAEARGRKDELVVDGTVAPALTAWWLPPDEGKASIGMGDYRTRMADSCASAMVALLNQGQHGSAAFVHGEVRRPLRPADIAVLVNNRSEAGVIRSALAARGVRSVYLSESETVFQTSQAIEVQHWLAACAEPDDPRLLRAALATPTLGLDWAQLERLNHDELAWEARVLQFRDYRECWRRQGVLPMLRRLINDFGLAARLVSDGTLQDGGGASGERVLTDVLHLAELLQQASTFLEGEHALIRHLAEQRQDVTRGGSGDVRQIRLESDADLVRVVTVHKAKGLEYPLVFLPFASSFREVTGKDAVLKYHQDDGRLRLVLNADAEGVARADRERHAEDLRKLYVALTRACYATWVGLAPVHGLEKSAFGYLLGGDGPVDGARLPELLAELGAAEAGITVSPAPQASLAAYAPPAVAVAAGAAREPLRGVREHWWIASYSALRGEDGEHHLVAETPREDVLREGLQGGQPGGSATPSDAAAGSLHTFPRGAEVGTFLHDLLEWVANEGFATVATAPERVRDTIARRCHARGWSAWIEPLAQWLQDFLRTPLHAAAAGSVPMTLAGVNTALAEMEFWVEAHTLDSDQIDQWVCRHTLDAVPRPHLQPARLNGMLKGYIDLIFEWQGVYYVVDYKSNWLGADDTAYTVEAMREAILAARYDLQYVLYLLALHRLLKARLPDYDYDRHVGGALYLFLRGSHAPTRGVHHERPPRVLIEALDALFAGGTAAEGVT